MQTFYALSLVCALNGGPCEQKALQVQPVDVQYLCRAKLFQQVYYGPKGRVYFGRCVTKAPAHLKVELF